MALTHDTRALAALPEHTLFDGLTESEAATLLERAGEGKVPGRTVLFAAGQPGELVYVLLTGTVRVQVEQEDGAVVVLTYLGPGDAIGEMGVIERSERSATVVTTEPCTYLWLDVAALQACLARSPRLAINLMRVLSRRLRLANDRVQSLARRDVAGRVAHQLLALADVFGEPRDGDLVVNLRLTQGELAGLVGASREHVNRALRGLESAGLVSTAQGYRFVLHDVAALRRRYP